MNTIVRWNPFREMAAMQSAMDRLFDENWRTVRPAAAGNALPLDVYETDAGYLIYTSMPGIEPDQISVSIEDDVLTISGEIPQPVFEDKDHVRVLLFERGYGKFTRSVRLGLPVDSDKVEAAYENGVLKLTLPKTAAVQPRQIQIKASKN